MRTSQLSDRVGGFALRSKLVAYPRAQSYWRQRGWRREGSREPAKPHSCRPSFGPLSCRKSILNALYHFNPRRPLPTRRVVLLLPIGTVRSPIASSATNYVSSKSNPPADTHGSALYSTLGSSVDHLLIILQAFFWYSVTSGPTTGPYI
jgi:hypothetical protein